MSQTTFTTKIDYPGVGATIVNKALLEEYDNAIHVLEGWLDPDDGSLSVHDILPTTDNTYNIGSASKQWHDGFFGGDVTANGAKVVKPYIVVATAEPADYVCDGTADDVQIQAALDAVGAAGGGTVFIKEGTYQIAAQLTITANVELRGAGTTATILALDSGVDDNLLMIGSNSKLSNLTIDGNDAGQTINTVDAVVLTSASENISIEDVIVHNSARHGIVVFDGLTDVYFNRIEAYDNYAGGIGIQGYGTNIHFSNVYSHDNGTVVVGGDGIVGYNPANDGVFVTDCYCYNNVGHGIHLGGKHINIENINVHNNTNQGLLLRNSDDSVLEEANVNNVFSYSNTSYNVGFYNIDGLTANNINAYLGSANGLNLQLCDNGTLSNLLIRDNTGAGIGLSTCTNLQFIGGKSWDSRTGGSKTQTYGFYSNYGTNISISFLDLRGNATDEYAFLNDTASKVEHLTTDETSELHNGFTVPTGSIIKSGTTNTNTLLLNANDTNFITFTTGATDTCTIAGATITGALTQTVSDGGALGSGTLMWSDLFLASGGVINFNNGNVVLTHSTGILTLTTGTLALGANNLTMTGSIADTTNRVTKGWFTDAEFTNTPTIGGSALGTIYAAVGQTFYIGTTQVAINRASAALTLAGITLTTPDIGVATATSVNKVAITAPANGSTLTIADAKTFTCNNTLTLSGTDSSTLNIGTGGTLGTGAYATIANYATLANPTFTGTVILPKAIEIQDTSADHQYVLAVSELTADRTITLPLLTAADTFVFNDFPATLTEKIVKLTAAPATDHTVSGTTIYLKANENQAFGDVCYINADGEAQLIDADAIATMSGIVMCADASIDADASGNYLVMGIARDDTWAWTVGGLIYGTVTGTTGNTLSQTAPSAANDVVQIMGVATHADRMLFKPSLVQVELT
jgi:hypothetical protein